ncbi:carboxy terminal-processing peptidase [Desulfogranum mediterraneum]|uniref:carboxy terminal-processing peptidase n=1 Tax=Desulfogranum mediterraneum TaxID=160661 RepID=UPI000406E78C|nr:carboxy terminal-processing peptidase [Desulfogranum mediterraneum]
MPRFTPPIACLLLLLTLLVPSGWAKVFPVEFNASRNQIIAYILSHQLPAQHFSHEPFDNSLSQAAFQLYIRQLDPRKRFLIQSDVDQLGAFADHIDDELKRGRIVLADAGAELLNDRIRKVQGFIDPLIAEGFDFNQAEYLEVDPEKVEYVADLAALKERWRKTLQLQILDTYFDTLDAEKKKAKAKEPAAAKKSSPPVKTREQRLAAAADKVQSRTHRVLKRLLQQSRQDHYNRYFDAVARAFDPHTNYMPPTSKEDFNIHMSGSLEGIGALLREDDGMIKVVRIIPGSAAERQGQLQGEDTILAVSEKDGDPVEISDMRIREAVSYIRGPKGSEVRLTVQKPDGSRLVIPIIRDVVQIEETYVKSTILPAEDRAKIGYLRIPSFYRDFAATSNGKKGRNVTDDTRRELERLNQDKIDGLILDLRNNGGGALTDAVYISGLFLPGGPVVQVKNSQGMIRVLEDEDSGVVYDGPLIVLVNQFSASASEILAAALQDYGRALVIGGKHTHGKGTVQALLDMNRNLPLLQLKKYDDLGALKLTIQKFYRINGGSTQFKGVEPDLVVPSMLDYLESGEQYMDNSLPWDQVEDVGYEQWQGARFERDPARRQGLGWVQSSKKFQQIRQEADRAKDRQENTRVAISLEGMRGEREALEATRKKAREAGLMDDAADDDSERRERPLSEQLDDDPFVQISLYLLENSAITGQVLSESP